MRFLTVAAAPVGSLAGGVLGTVIGLRGTLWVIAFLGVLLGAAALAWSPVRGHRVLPAAAD
jgi:predicted MFS family arabinose efflux permease